MNTNYTETDQSGNVLFLILIAVALFAALSFAVTSSSRNTAGDISEETLGMQSSQLLAYASGIRTAMQRLIAKGCTIEQVNFFHSLSPVTYSNPSSPPDFSCHVFDPRGASIHWFIPRDEFYDMNDLASDTQGGHAFFTNDTHIEGIGTVEPDLYLVIRSIDRNLCRHINERLAVNLVGGSIPVFSGAGNFFGDPYNGTLKTSLDAGYSVLGDDVAEAPYNGKFSGCIVDVDKAVFYTVLIEQ